MSNPHQLLYAPQGERTAHDPAALPQNRALLLRGVLPARGGELRNAYPLVTGENQEPAAHEIRGLAVYYGSRPELHRILAVSGTVLYAAPYSWQDFGTYTKLVVGVWQPVGLFTVTQNPPELRIGALRSAQFGNELFLVAEGEWVNADPSKPVFGSIVRRFYVNESGQFRFYKAGIDPPPTPTVTNVGGVGKTGTYRYRITYVDELGRESSPAQSAAITVPDPGDAIQVAFAWPSADRYDLGGQVTAVNIYVTLNNGDVYYLIHTETDTSVTTYTDSAPDAAIDITAPTAPHLGQNDPPRKASLITVWKSRLVLNDTTNLNDVQISNVGAPTQFNALPTTDIDSDGITLTIGSDPGDQITGLHPFGSLLGVWKKSTYHQVTGDTPSEFAQRPVHNVGCLSPDSIVRCDNEVLFLWDDGLYSISYLDGFTVRKVSQDIDDLFRGRIPISYAPGQTETDIHRAMERAVAFYLEQRYFLSIGDRTLCYDMAGRSPLSEGGFSEPGYKWIFAAKTLSSDLVPNAVLLAVSDEFGVRVPQFVYITPLIPDKVDIPGVRPAAQIEVKWRPFDGGEVPRNRQKVGLRLDVWGELRALPFSAFGYLGELLLESDSGHTETYPLLDASGNGIIYPAGQILQQHMTPMMRGKMLTAHLTVFYPERLRMTDARMEYLLVD